MDNLEKIAEHYSSDAAKTSRYIVEIDGINEGYIQYYHVKKYHFGTDLFVARADMLSRGHGSNFLLTFIDMISELEIIGK